MIHRVSKTDIVEHDSVMIRLDLNLAERLVDVKVVQTVHKDLIGHNYK
jgi:hypothetical protein